MLLFFFLLHAQCVATMVRSGSLEVSPAMKAVWRFASTRSGGPSVTTPGVTWMLLWSAELPDSPASVSLLHENRMPGPSSYLNLSHRRNCAV